MLIAAQFALATPLLETPDSVGHYQYIRSLAREGRFPTLPSPDRLYSPGQEAGQFPLYYLVGAALILPISDNDLESVVIPDPHGLAQDGLTKNYAFHRPWTGFPGGAELAIRIVELFSMLCGATTVACAVLLCRLYKPESPQLWLGAGVAVAVLPAFASLSGGVSNDNLVVALSSITVVLHAQWLKDDDARWPWVAAFALSLAVLAKFNAIGLIGCYLFTVGWRHRKRWRGWLREIAKLATAALVVDGWWIARNLRLYGEPTGLLALNRQMYGAAYSPFTVSTGEALQHVASQVPRIFHDFFVTFGHYNINAPQAFAVVAATGALGLLAGLASALPEWRRPLVQLVLLWAALVLAETAAYVVLSDGFGRFMYPALAPLAVLAATGWERILSFLRWRWFGYALVAACAATASVCAWVVVKPAFAYPPTLMAVPMSAAPLQARFAGAVELVGVEAPREPLTEAGKPVPLTLYWRRTGPLELPLSEFIHVESSDPTYDPGARFEGATGGNFPPNFWTSGQIVVDQHALALKPDTRADRRNAVRLSVRAGMYYLSGHAGATAQRVQADPPQAADAGVEVASSKIPGQPPPDGPERALAQFENGLDLLEARVQSAGAQLSVELRWQARAVPPANATVFMQALGADGELLGQHDSYPLEGRYPTSQWSAGEQVFDRVTLQLTRPLAAEDRVIAGMYVLPQADRRIPTRGGASFVMLQRP